MGIGNRDFRNSYYNMDDRREDRNFRFRNDRSDRGNNFRYNERRRPRNYDDSKNIFSKSLDTKIRRYFFDVKTSSNGSKYLVISETRRQDGRLERDRIFIFQEDLDAFKDIYLEAMESFDDKTDKGNNNENEDLGPAEYNLKDDIQDKEE